MKQFYDEKLKKKFMRSVIKEKYQRNFCGDMEKIKKQQLKKYRKNLEKD